MVRSCASAKRSGCSACNLAISALPVASGSACNQTSTSPQTPSKGSLAGPPVPGTSDPGRVSRSDLTLAPQPGQLGKELAQAFALRGLPHFRSSRRHQGDWASRMVCSNNTGSSLDERGPHVIAGGSMLDQPVAGRGRRTVTLDGGASIPGLVDQLE